MNAFAKMIHLPEKPANPVHVEFTCFEYSEHRVAVSAQYAELEVVHITRIYEEPILSHDCTSDNGYMAVESGVAFTAKTTIKEVHQRLSDEKMQDVSLLYFLDHALEQDLKNAIQAAAVLRAECQARKEAGSCD
jgi:hypothetical protein